MEKVMNEENYWDHNVEGDVVEGPVDCVYRDDVVHLLIEMKTGKSPDLDMYDRS